jgi:hypothetical protein
MTLQKIFCISVFRFWRRRRFYTNNIRPFFGEKNIRLTTNKFKSVFVFVFAPCHLKTSLLPLFKMHTRNENENITDKKLYFRMKNSFYNI